MLEILLKISSLIKFLSFAFYVLAFIGFVFFVKTEKKEALRLSHLFLATGLFSLGFLIFCEAYRYYLTSSYTFQTSLYLLIFFITLSYFWLFSKRYPVAESNLFVLPFLIFFFLVSFFLPSNLEMSLKKYFKSFWLPFHITFSLLSDGFLLVAGIYSFIYFMEEREIKRKRLGFFFSKMPSLSVLDSIIEKYLYLGFLFYTIGIITGLMWNKTEVGVFWNWSFKEVISFIFWGLYAVILHQRILIGWKGRKTALMTLILCGLWFFQFFVLNFTLSGFHTYR